MYALRRSVFLPETHELADGDIFPVDADAVLTAVCMGWLSEPWKSWVPHCEDRPGAAHSRKDHPLSCTSRFRWMLVRSLPRAPGR